MLTNDDVIQAFSWLLNRPPESQDIIDRFRQFDSAQDLRSHLMSIPEFYNQIRAHSNLVPANNWVCKEILGARHYRLWLNLYDKGVSLPCLLNEYENTETRLVKSLVFAGDTFCDFGANIGWFSLLAASLVGESGKVHSFEPSPYIFPYLDRSVRESDFSRSVNLHRVALGTAEEFVMLVKGEDTINPGGSSISAIENRASNKHEYFVKSQRFDDIVPDCRPSFIKIDVEGAEMIALSGARDAIMRSKPIIMCEINPNALAIVSRCSALDLATFICGMGYTPMSISDHSLHLITPSDIGNAAEGWFNVIFCPTQLSGHLTSLQF